MISPADLQVSKLPDRYGIGRTQVYARLNALKSQNETLCQFQSGGKSWVNAVVLAHLDKINDLMSQGYSLDDAAEISARYSQTDILPNDGQTLSTEHRSQSSASSGAIVPVDHSALSSEESPIVGKIRQEVESGAFARYELLDQLSERGWCLPSSELAAILGMTKLAGKEFERFGYIFTRQGRAGSQYTWQVTKGV